MVFGIRTLEYSQDLTPEKNNTTCNDTKRLDPDGTRVG